MKRLDGYQRRTSILVVLSSITTALTLFAIFRFTAEIVSVGWIGAWSLVQGLLLVARVSDSGAGNNISRVIAVRAKGELPLELRSTTMAALLIASLPSVVLAAVATPLIGLYVTMQFGAELDRHALWNLVWLALLNATLAAVSNILLAVCEGVFELNFRSLAVIAGNLTGLAALVPLLNIAGPLGVGWVYVLISGTQVLLAGLRVTRLVHSDISSSQRTVRAQIAILWRENLHLSGIAVIRLSFEPVTKFLLSLFAPLAVIAQFELALRVTTQIRTIIQSAMQPLLVLGARPADVSGSTGIEGKFIRNDRAISYLSTGMLISQLLAAPAIQWLGLGAHDLLFTVFFALLATGNAINTMGLSGYYWQMSSGTLIPLVRVQSYMAISNTLVGTTGFALRSSTLVVTAYALTFAYGGLVSRSFLPGIARTRKVTSTLVTVGAAFTTSALLLVLQPSSPAALSVSLSGAIAVAVVCLYATYKTSRRGI